jgi:hypothetical protein
MITGKPAAAYSNILIGYARWYGAPGGGPDRSALRQQSGDSRAVERAAILGASQPGSRRLRSKRTVRLPGEEKPGMPGSPSPSPARAASRAPRFSATAPT